MTIIPAKTPGFVKSLFPNFVWQVKTDKKVIYLTFDDGPTPEVTDWVIKTLDEYNAKATFFCIGHNVISHPDIYQSILDHGHQVGNHTHNHLKGWKTDTQTYMANIEKASTYISSNLFRPPYGKFKSKQGKLLIKNGYKIIMWDVLSFDWDKHTTEEICLKNVAGKATSGSIVVFHDSKKAFKNLAYTLPRTLQFFTEKGYVFEALDF